VNGSCSVLFGNLQDVPAVVRSAGLARAVRPHQLAALSARGERCDGYLPRLRAPLVPPRLRYFTFRANHNLTSEAIGDYIIDENPCQGK